MQLTMRQVDLLLRKIDMRRHNNYAAQAGLHGIKIPFRRVEEEQTPLKLSTDEHKAAIGAMENAIKRLEERAKKRG